MTRGINFQEPSRVVEKNPGGREGITDLPKRKRGCRKRTREKRRGEDWLRPWEKNRRESDQEKGVKRPGDTFSLLWGKKERSREKGEKKKVLLRKGEVRKPKNLVCHERERKCRHLGSSKEKRWQKDPSSRLRHEMSKTSKRIGALYPPKFSRGKNSGYGSQSGEKEETLEGGFLAKGKWGTMKKKGLGF